MDRPGLMRSEFVVLPARSTCAAWSLEAIGQVRSATRADSDRLQVCRWESEIQAIATTSLIIFLIRTSPGEQKLGCKVRSPVQANQTPDNPCRLAELPHRSAALSHRQSATPYRSAVLSYRSPVLS